MDEHDFLGDFQVAVSQSVGIRYEPVTSSEVLVGPSKAIPKHFLVSFDSVADIGLAS